MEFTFRDVIAEQKKPLDYKIEKAVTAIGESFRVSKQAVGLSFSGGKDSTVLWHLVRTYFPEADYHVIFSNTTVEFPESLKFARKLGSEWADGDKVKFHEVLPARTQEEGLKYQAQREVLAWLIETGRVGEVLKPDGKLKSTKKLEQMATPEMLDDFRARNLVWPKGTMMAFQWCCDQYGYPILGKAAGKLTARRINIDCFLRFAKSESKDEETREYYDLLRNVKTSNHCCTVLKKEPAERCQAEIGIDVIMKGLMAEESHSRLLSFATRGYLFRSSRPHAPDFYHCSPLGIWRDADIWEYIRLYDVPYSPLYDRTYLGRDGERHHIKRNGCVGCCTDIAFPDNHMSVLRRTHPRSWERIMADGMGEQLLQLQQYYGNGNKSLLSKARNISEAVWQAPCEFDNIGEHIRDNKITRSQYDSEMDGQLGLFNLTDTSQHEGEEA